MMDKDEARNLIDDLFEEEALMIGGLVALFELRDDVVRHLVKALDFVRRKSLRRIEDASSAGGAEPARRGATLRPHPAIADFLRSVREG